MTYFETVDEWKSHWKNEFDNDLEAGFGATGPGGAVHITRGSDVEFSEEFGKASVANGMDFTVDTPCGIRSVTKTMTAALVLKAEMDSHFNTETEYPGGILDRPISDFSVIANNHHRWVHKYLPEDARDLSLAPPTYPTSNPISIDCSLRALACHNSRNYAIGKWADLDEWIDSGKKKWLPCYSAEKPWWNSGDKWSEYTMEDNLVAYKNLTETIGSVDDIVAMAGAVLRGPNPDTVPDLTDPNNFVYGNADAYTDKAGWLEAAICEEMLGDSYYNLLQKQFDHMGLTNAYPSSGGNVYFGWDKNSDSYHTLFRGHHAHGKEIRGLAVAYSSGPANPDGTGEALYLEPNQSTESAYAIGSAVMSVKDLARWGRELRTNYYVDNGYLTPLMSNEIFTVQTQADDRMEAKIFKAVNYTFGAAKMQDLATDSGAPLSATGMIGQGGFRGYGGAIVWVNDADMVFAAVANGGITVSKIYQMAEDYAESFL